MKNIIAIILFLLIVCSMPSALAFTELHQLDLDALDGYGILQNPQTETCTDTGDGNAGALTIARNKDLVKITVLDSDGCDITLSETGAVDGMQMLLLNVSTSSYSFTITHSAGVQNINGGGSIVVGQYQQAIAVYSTNTWIVTQ